MAETHAEIVLAGSGGQGLVVSGIMLAEAAMLEGKNVVQTTSYGIATRGGFSMAEVIIDTGEILFQQVRRVDLALVLTEEAMEKFHGAAEAGAWVFYDTTLMKPRRGGRMLGRPFTGMAGDLGRTNMANVIALGAMAGVTGMVRASSLADVVESRFSGKAREMNLKALEKGVRLADEFLLSIHDPKFPEAPGERQP